MLLAQKRSRRARKHNACPTRSLISHLLKAAIKKKLHEVLIHYELLGAVSIPMALTPKIPLSDPHTPPWGPVAQSSPGGLHQHDPALTRRLQTRSSHRLLRLPRPGGLRRAAPASPPGNGRLGGSGRRGRWAEAECTGTSPPPGP